jgi:hypothetical protein
MVCQRCLQAFLPFQHCMPEYLYESLLVSSHLDKGHSLSKIRCRHSLSQFCWVCIPSLPHLKNLTHTLPLPLILPSTASPILHHDLGNLEGKENHCSTEGAIQMFSSKIGWGVCLLLAAKHLEAVKKHTLFVMWL